MRTPFIFLTMFDYPTRYAHAVHGLHMARAFSAREDLEFNFLVNTVTDDTLAGIPHTCLFGSWGRWVKKARLRRALLPLAFGIYMMQHRRLRRGVIFLNDPALLFVAMIAHRLFGFRIIFESHSLLSERKKAILNRHATCVLGVSEGICADVRASLTAVPVHHLPNAVAVRAYDHKSADDRVSLRKELGIGTSDTVLGYIGRLSPLGEDKGIALMLEGLVQLPKKTVALLVGAAKQEVETFSALAVSHGVADRVFFVPHVQPDAVPRYVLACDVLIFVPPGGTVFFEKETSPMKLYEYMASKRPIIVSDVPTNRAVLTDDEARFVRAGSVSEFVAAVAEVTSPVNAPKVYARAEAAYARVRSNSWDYRVGQIVEWARA
ncbi:MAG: glycosyltransferase family 4 protein [Candidatus Pacebacteria bacterium]|nr:glycosyltransferase family 4 protein [Candidatus Paceibacterota bacterium]